MELRHWNIGTLEGWELEYWKLESWEIEAADWNTGNLVHWHAWTLNYCANKTLKISKLGTKGAGSLTHWNIGKLVIWDTETS